MKKILTLAVLSFIVHICFAQQTNSKTKTFSANGFEISLTPSAKDELYWNKMKNIVLSNAVVKQRLANTDYAVLAEEFVPSANENDEVYQLTIFDYSKNICLLIEYNKLANDAVKITETDEQPNSNDEEFERARDILLNSNKYLANGYASGMIKFYKPMPPLDFSETVNGKVQRVLTVGIESADPSIPKEIVGVNMINHAVIHYKNGAPLTSKTAHDDCGIPNARQKTTKRIKGDTYQLTIKKGGIVLWDMLVTRPRSSSGTNASGIELQNVFYSGKPVMKQAHVPILNVLYDSNKCGPYRDWLYEESYFQANGKSAGEGFVICEKRPKTLFESESDSGNFQGVAIWAGDSVVSMISETEAGWYRYITEWRFYANGTILPLFEFSAVKNSCVCNIHHHHVYWRFDFDIDGLNNQASEYSDGIGWADINVEGRRLNDTSVHRQWRIMNTQTGNGYQLIPGDNDGTEDEAFGRGDFWVLHNNPNEIDDHSKQWERKKSEDISKYINGESTANTDIVIWYTAHFTHDVSELVDHQVGPKLVYVRSKATGKQITSDPVKAKRQQTSVPAVEKKKKG